MATAKNATAPKPLTLEERIALSTAPGWRPTPGETLESATVVGLGMHEHEEYGKTPCITYRLQDGNFIKVYAFHTVLRERLAELKTNIGSVQTLRYLGSQTSNTRVDANGAPQRYESYYVENADTEMTAVSEDFAF